MPRKITKKPTRRGNNEGSIYQRKDGKWCGQVLLGYKPDGKPNRKTFYGKTREEVARKVAEATHQVFSGTVPTEKEKLKVEQLMQDFLWTFKRPTVTDVTFEWYLNLASAHIVPSLGKLDVCDVTAMTVQRFINNLHTEKGLAARTIKAVRDLLKQAFAHAAKLKFIDRNPVLDTKLPKQPRAVTDRDDDKKVITRAERSNIIAAAEGDLRMKTALTVLMFTGMRVGEFLALPWKNVDFENGKLTKRRTVVGGTKTQCSNRSFRVTPVVIEVLREWREALPEHMRCRPKHDILAPEAVVFPNDLGEMRTYDGFRTTYRRFMAANGLGDYTLHSYRHTFATMLLETGVNPKVVQKMLGHRDIETTLGIYSHVLAEVYDGVVEAITEIHERLRAADVNALGL